MIYSIHGILCDSNYLEHHGIKGQKWGVQNGPPYPLGAGDHSKAEQKAGWRSSLGKAREVARKTVKKVHSVASERRQYKRDSQQFRRDDNKHLTDLREQRLIEKYGETKFLRNEAVDSVKRGARTVAAMMYLIGPTPMSVVLSAVTVRSVANEISRTENKMVQLAKNQGRFKLNIADSDSKVTAQAKTDFNNLSNSAFMNKYSISKDAYYIRVVKYGDPYMKAPAAILGKMISKDK